MSKLTLIHRWILLAALALPIVAVVFGPYIIGWAYVNAGVLILARSNTASDCALGLPYAGISRQTANHAGTMFERALAWHPTNERAYRFLGELALARGEEAQARDYLARVARSDPNDLFAVGWTGYLEDKAGNHEMARALWSGFHSGPFLIALGDCFRGASEDKSAERYYTLAVDVSGYTLGYLRLGDMFVEQNRLERAVDAYSTLLVRTRESDELAGARLALGKIYTRQGHDQEAERYFQAGFRESAIGPYAAEIGLFLRRERRFAAAERWLKEWARLSPNSPDPQRALGLNALNMGRPAEAALYLEQAMRAGGKSGQVFLGLGNAYEQLGQIGRARTMYQHVLQLDPQNVQARKRLQILEAKEER